MFRSSVLGLSLLSVCFLLGCGGGDGIERTAVQGQVSFNGEPVEEGLIYFIPAADVEGAPVQIPILQGRYDSAQAGSDRGVVIGKNRVEITAFKKTGKQVRNPMNEMEEEILQYIPAKYNTNSTLEQEIQAGENQFDFELTP